MSRRDNMSQLEKTSHLLQMKINLMPALARKAEVAAAVFKVRAKKTRPEKAGVISQTTLTSTTEVEVVDGTAVLMETVVMTELPEVEEVIAVTTGDSVEALAITMIKWFTV